MSADVAKQHIEIRRILGLRDDAPLNGIVCAMVTQQSALQATANKAGISSQSLKEYCNLFAKGMQWAHEKYGAEKKLLGPEGLSFGRAGETINVNLSAYGCVAQIIVKPVPDLNWINLESPTSKVTVTHLVMPWDDMLQFHQHKADLDGFSVKAKSRAVLGKMTMQELTFLAGVEEAYHAIQAQDPEIAARLAAEQAELEQRVGDVEAYCKQNNLELHDVLPRELDVVPILERALAEHRLKQQRNGPQ